MQSIIEYLKFTTLYTLLVFAFVFPFFIIAIWRIPSANRKLIILIPILFFIDRILSYLPSVIFISPQGLFWQGKILQIVWPILFILIYRHLTFSDIGITSKINSGSFRPIILIALLLLFLKILEIVYGSRRPANIEWLLFMMIMPGLSEELIFRGVFQSLLNRSFGKQWNLWGAKIGFGLILTSLIFGIEHFQMVNKAGIIHFNGPLYLPPFYIGFALGWIRERSGSLLPCIIVHNLINVLPVIAGYLLL
jgi:membrane protease YdiL (CAAX protease family)